MKINGKWVKTKAHANHETDMWAHYWEHADGSEGGEMWINPRGEHGPELVDFDGAVDLPDYVYRELWKNGVDTGHETIEVESPIFGPKRVNEEMFVREWTESIRSLIHLLPLNEYDEIKERVYNAASAKFKEILENAAG